MIENLFWLGLVGALIALIFAVAQARKVLKFSEGTELMQKLAASIRKGANAYLKRQYTTVAKIFIVVFVILLILAGVGMLDNWFIPFAFLTGGIYSALAGFVGMKIATYANVRVSNQARETHDIGKTLKIAFRGGSVMVAVDSDGRTATITVADTGIGMDKAAVRHAFDKFFRAATSAGGTGIGLAIVKAFAELHGGRATVASTPGAGSTFTVELPLGQPHAESAEAWNLAADGGRELPPTAEDDDKTETDIITSEAEPEGLPLALVVDDSADMRSYIARLLEGRCRVAEAAMDGLEMCRSVKEATATSHVPVVLLTSRAGEDSRAEGYDCGADAYITKPFSGKVLLSRVQNLLDGRRRLKYAFEAGARQPQAEQAACDPSAGFLADFRQAVLNNLADSSLSVETLGAELGLSRVQLYRKVKSLTGSSPVEIIRITRLQRADHLLKTTDKTIAEISYDVGFSSPSYFSKCFRDYFGAQPGEVRDRKRGLGC